MKYLISVKLNKLTIYWQSDFEKARLYYLKHGIDITFNFTQVNVTGYKSEWQSGNSRWLVFGTQNLITLDNNADVNMFVLNQMEWATPAGSQFPLKTDTPSGCTYQVGNKPYIVVAVSPFDETNGENWIQIAHEILHSIRITANIKGYPIKDVLDTYRLNSTPDAPTGNFAEQFGLLDSFIKMNKWKYFKLTEWTNSGHTHTVSELNTHLVDLLDIMRGECGFPFRITSGKRTKAENDNLIDAVGNSAHLTGLSVDIQCITDEQRFKMIQSAFQNGIKRIGIAKGYLHFDVDNSKPQEVVWLYN